MQRPRGEDTHILKGGKEVRIRITLLAMCCGAKQAGKGRKNGVGREEIDLNQNGRNIFNVVQGPEGQGWTETLLKISGSERICPING